MRCPTCGARNGDAATFCTQCYADLTGRPAPTATPVREERGAAEPVAAPGADRRPSDGASRDVRTVDGEVEWRCQRCEHWSPLGAERCWTCGSPRTGFGDPPPRADVPAGRRPALIGASVLLPGLGHLLARRTGTGVARMVLAVSWLLGGVTIARAAAASAAGLLPAVPLLLGAVVVWAGSVADVATLDRRELLRPRVLTVLTGVVLGTLVLALLATATGGAAASS